MEIYEFKTIDKAVEDVLLKEKGSKFLGYAYPVSNDKELKERLDHIRTIHPKATHYCYAFRMGLNGENYRANDDGEPSGSAGLPIFNQLLANEITNILLIVVRYYGGTKLGVSGLVKTYKESAKLTLEECEIVTQELEVEIEITVPFHMQNTIFTLINKIEGKVINFDTTDVCKINAKLKKRNQDALAQQLEEMQHVTFEWI